MTQANLTTLDGAARDSGATQAGRVAAALFLLAIMAISPTFRGVAKVWGPVQMSTEALLWAATRPHRLRWRPVVRDTAYLAAGNLNNLAWIVLSIDLWIFPAGRMPYVSLLIWTCLLMNSTGLALYSARATLTFATPVCITLVAAPLLRPVPGAPAAVVVGGGAIVAGYAGLAYYRNARVAAALRKANAALEQQRIRADDANEAKSVFLANVSHEIRTPLNGVLGMAEAMERDALNDQQKARLDVIRRSGETLLALLNDVLDLSRIEAGRLEIEDGAVNLEEIAQSAVQTFTALAADKDIHLSASVDPALEGYWRGDPTRVRQILFNLTSNAVKFTSDGEVRIRLSRADGRYLVSVRDTGAGIPADRLDALFSRFEQVDASTTRRFGGTGLGLAICRELAERMGGAIAVESELGQGSTFTVSLPLQPATAEQVRKAQETAREVSGEAVGGLRILVAEDNPVNQLVLKGLLEPFELELHMVGDGREAVAASRARAYDVILMDIHMPEMDGLAATALIRAQDAERGTHTPVIALTANAMAHQAESYRDAGIDGLVAKPIRVAELLAEIERVLAARAAPAEIA